MIMIIIIMIIILIMQMTIIIIIIIIMIIMIMKIITGGRGHQEGPGHCEDGQQEPAPRLLATTFVIIALIIKVIIV